MSGPCILDSGTHKPGDPPPEGYLQWHAWAEVQHKAGLRQKACGRCGLFKFPQELSEKIIKHKSQTRTGRPVIVVEPLCLKCASTPRADSGEGGGNG
jgi:hypothetical protein